ncbi:MAG TPA: sigma-70 family RNA polymerase sigma factor [Gemmataceae bacterium]|nr:sigma-70 family RNA polymerase sigma factor [Gemmataceae bacterium]
MAEKPPQAARCFAGAGAAGGPPDAELLRRFAADRGEEAFALLVKRHGPLVLSVCRRVLGTDQDAEDAFQATFLVLARKAATIRDPGLLGNWLYGVASRIARKARASQRKRQDREKLVRTLPSPQVPPAGAGDDLGSVLDEELRRLPEKYRAAVGLCYLEGKTNAEAASLLRWPTGTLKGRLARARDLLRGRLVRRGLGAIVLGLATFLVGSDARAAAASDPPAACQFAACGFAGTIAKPQAAVSDPRLPSGHRGWLSARRRPR